MGITAVLVNPSTSCSQSRQVVRLRAKLTGAAGAIKGVFGIKSEQDPAVAKLEALQVSINTFYGQHVILHLTPE